MACFLRFSTGSTVCGLGQEGPLHRRSCVPHPCPQQRRKSLHSPFLPKEHRVPRGEKEAKDPQADTVLDVFPAKASSGRAGFRRIRVPFLPVSWCNFLPVSWDFEERVLCWALRSSEEEGDTHQDRQHQPSERRNIRKHRQSETSSQHQHQHQHQHTTPLINHQSWHAVVAGINTTAKGRNSNHFLFSYP